MSKSFWVGLLLVILGGGIVAYGLYPTCPTGTICVDNSRLYAGVGITVIVMGFALVLVHLLMRNTGLLLKGGSTSGSP